MCGTQHSIKHTGIEYIVGFTQLYSVCCISAQTVHTCSTIQFFLQLIGNVFMYNYSMGEFLK